jgi:hypothetical protein
MNPLCPSCLGELPGKPGQVAKCRHCASEIFWGGDKPFKTKGEALSAAQSTPPTRGAKSSSQKPLCCKRCQKAFIPVSSGDQYCSWCKPQHCKDCGQSYDGNTHDCPVTTGRHFQREDTNPDSSREGESCQSERMGFGLPEALCNHYKACRLQFEKRHADKWPPSFFTWTPVERRSLEQVLCGEKTPVVLSDVRVTRYLAANMERLVFPYVRRVDERCASHLAKSGKTIRLEGLDYLGNVLAEILARSDGSLYLRCNKHFNEQTAIRLARHEGRLLSLRNLLSLSVATAARLSFHSKKLQLVGLTKLTVAVAEQLKNHRGSAIGLKSVTMFEPGAAEMLAKYQGKRLYLNSIKYPPPDLALALSGFGGKVKYGGEA